MFVPHDTTTPQPAIYPEHMGMSDEALIGRARALFGCYDNESTQERQSALRVLAQRATDARRRARQQEIVYLVQTGLMTAEQAMEAWR